jgi:3D (Asp-Asp-Asp) domain-containing protein
MADQQAVIPIVNGETILFYGGAVQNTVTISGTVYTILMQDVSLWSDGASVSSSNALPVEDPLVETNTGSIVAQNSTIIGNLGSLVTAESTAVALLGSIAASGANGATAANQTAEIANLGSINAGIGTLVSHGSTLASIANQGSILTNQATQITSLGSMVTELAAIEAQIATGVLTNAGQYTLVALDNSILNAGTAVTLLSAGHATAGGFIVAPVSMNINQIGTAGTTAGGSNIPVNAGATYEIIPSAGAVSGIISTGTSIAVAGYGLQPVI